MPGQFQAALQSMSTSWDALFGGATATSTATASNTLTSFLDASKLEFREFYAAACPHCVHLKPVWDAAVRDYSGDISWRQIECNDQHWAPVAKNAQLCRHIDGFPTMKMYDTSTGADADATELGEYRGPRDAKSLGDFVKSFESSGGDSSTSRQD